MLSCFSQKNLLSSSLLILSFFLLSSETKSMRAEEEKELPRNVKKEKKNSILDDKALTQNLRVVAYNKYWEKFLPEMAKSFRIYNNYAKSNTIKTDHEVLELVFQKKFQEGQYPGFKTVRTRFSELYKLGRSYANPNLFNPPKEALAYEEYWEKFLPEMAEYFRIYNNYAKNNIIKSDHEILEILFGKLKEGQYPDFKTARDKFSILLTSGRPYAKLFDPPEEIEKKQDIEFNNIIVDNNNQKIENNRRSESEKLIELYHDPIRKIIVDYDENIKDPICEVLEQVESYSAGDIKILTAISKRLKAQVEDWYEIKEKKTENRKEYFGKHGSFFEIKTEIIKFNYFDDIQNDKGKFLEYQRDIISWKRMINAVLNNKGVPDDLKSVPQKLKVNPWMINSPYVDILHDKQGIEVNPSNVLDAEKEFDTVLESLECLRRDKKIIQSWERLPKPEDTLMQIKQQKNKSSEENYKLFASFVDCAFIDDYFNIIEYSSSNYYIRDLSHYDEIYKIFQNNPITKERVIVNSRLISLMEFSRYFNHKLYTEFNGAVDKIMQLFKRLKKEGKITNKGLLDWESIPSEIIEMFKEQDQKEKGKMDLFTYVTTQDIPYYNNFWKENKLYKPSDSLGSKDSLRRTLLDNYTTRCRTIKIANLIWNHKEEKMIQDHILAPLLERLAISGKHCSGRMGDETSGAVVQLSRSEFATKQLPLEIKLTAFIHLLKRKAIEEMVNKQGEFGRNWNPQDNISQLSHKQVYIEKKLASILGLSSDIKNFNDTLSGFSGMYHISTDDLFKQFKDQFNEDFLISSLENDIRNATYNKNGTIELSDIKNYIIDAGKKNNVSEEIISLILDNFFDFDKEGNTFVPKEAIRAILYIFGYLEEGD